jgi:sialic acid synthase SpsE
VCSAKLKHYVGSPAWAGVDAKCVALRKNFNNQVAEIHNVYVLKMSKRKKNRKEEEEKKRTLKYVKRKRTLKYVH